MPRRDSLRRPSVGLSVTSLPPLRQDTTSDLSYRPRLVVAFALLLPLSSNCPPGRPLKSRVYSDVKKSLVRCNLLAKLLQASTNDLNYLPLSAQICFNATPLALVLAARVASSLAGAAPLASFYSNSSCRAIPTGSTGRKTESNLITTASLPRTTRRLWNTATPSVLPSSKLANLDSAAQTAEGTEKKNPFPGASLNTAAVSKGHFITVGGSCTHEAST